MNHLGPPSRESEKVAERLRAGCRSSRSSSPAQGLEMTTGSMGELMPTVFVSYRRDDAAESAGRLARALSRSLGEENVFFDVESLRGGQNWVNELFRLGQLCDFVLAVIGPRWMEPGANGRPRICEKGDAVRLEIESVHCSGSTVIPILVDGATMPTTQDLPANLRVIGFNQAVTVNGSSFDRDVARLVADLDGHERAAPPPDFSGKWSDLMMSGSEFHVVQNGPQLMVTAIHRGQVLGRGMGHVSGRTAAVHFGDQFSGTALHLTLSLNGRRASGEMTSAGHSQEINLFRSDRARPAMTPQVAEIADRAIGVVLTTAALGGLAYGAKKLGQRFRQRREQKQAETSPPAAGSIDPVEQLERLAELHAARHLSDAEFDQAKARLFEKGSP
jgi:TIR domain